MAIERSVNIKLTAEDKLTPQVKKAASAINTHLIKAINSSNMSMRAKEKALKAVNVQAEKNIFIVNNITQNNQKFQQSIDQTAMSMVSLADRIEKTHSYIQILGQAFVFLVGQQKAFDILKKSAHKLSLGIQVLINHVEDIGGPFKYLIPILKIVRDLMGSNLSAFAAFAIIGGENVESANNVREELMLLTGQTLTFTQKLKLSSIALSRYGDIMLSTDGIMAKIKGSALKVGAALSFGLGSALDSASELKTEALLVSLSLAAVATIPSLFDKVNSKIEGLAQTLNTLNIKIYAVERAYKSNFKGATSFMRALDSLSKDISGVFRKLGGDILTSFKNFDVGVKNLNLFESQFILKFANIRGALSSVISDFRFLQDSVGAMRTNWKTLLKLRVSRFFKNVGISVLELNKQISRSFNTLATVVVPKSISLILNYFDFYLTGLEKTLEVSGRMVKNLGRIIRQSIMGTLTSFTALEDSFKRIGKEGSKLIFNVSDGLKALYRASTEIKSAALQKRQNFLTAIFHKRLLASMKNVTKIGIEGMLIPLRLLNINNEKLTKSFSFLINNFLRFNSVLSDNSQIYKSIASSVKSLNKPLKDLVSLFKTLSFPLVELLSHASTFKAINMGRMFRNAGIEVFKFSQHLGKAVINFRNTKLASRELAKSFKYLTALGKTLSNTAVIIGGSFFHLYGALKKSGLTVILMSFTASLGVVSSSLSLFLDLIIAIPSDLLNVSKQVMKLSSLIIIASENISDFSIKAYNSTVILGRFARGKSVIFFKDFSKSIVKAKSSLQTFLKVSKNVQTSFEGFEKASAIDIMTSLISKNIDTIKLKILSMKSSFNILKAQSKNFSKSMGSAFNSFASNIDRATLDVNTFSGYVRNKATESLLRFSRFGIRGVIIGLGKFKEILGTSHSILAPFAEQIKVSSSITAKFAKTAFTAAKHTEFFEKGLAGFVARASIFSTSMAGIGMSLLKSDSAMKKFTGVTLIALSAALGGLTYIIQRTITALGGLITKIGTSLTKASEKQIEVFAKGQQSTFAFTQTLIGYSHSAEEAAKSTNTWNNFIEKMASSTGAGTGSLRALVAETVGATEAFNLNQKQMETLIERSVDLSERAHRPAINTLTSLIQAINGNSAGLAVYGLHLNKTAINQSKLTQETKDGFDKLGDIEKGQARYNVLMDQAGKAAGFASSNMFTYNKALKMQKTAIKGLMGALGKGAEVINGSVSGSLTAITVAFTNIAKPILPLIGFLQALTGRFMQIGGVIVSHTLSIGLLISTYKALNKALASKAGLDFFKSELPVIGKSFTKLAESIGIVNPKFSSLKEIAVTAMQATKIQLGKAIKETLGLNVATKLTARTVGVALYKSVKKAMIATWEWVVAKRALLIEIAILIAIGAILYKTVVMLEKRFGIFSKLLNNLKVAFSSNTEATKQSSKAYLTMSSILSNVLEATIKTVAASLLILLNGVLTITWAIGKLSQVFNYLGLSSLAMSDKKMQQLEKSLQQVSTIANKLSGEVGNSLANAFISSASASDRLDYSLGKHLKKIFKLSSAFSKLSTKAKEAFEFVSDLTPQLNLRKMQEDSKKYKAQLQSLIQKGKDLNKALFNSKSRDFSAIDKNDNKIIDAQIALEAIKLKLSQQTRITDLTLLDQQLAQEKNKVFTIAIESAQKVRTSKLEILDIQLSQERNKIFTFEMEQSKRKKESLLSTKQLVLDFKTQELIEKRNLEKKYGLSSNTEALLAANQQEMQMFRDQLQAKMDLSISMEQQKKTALAGIKAGLLQGTDAGASATEDNEVLRMKNRMAKITTLRLADADQKRAFAQIKEQFEIDSENRRLARVQANVSREATILNQKIARSEELSQAMVDIHTRTQEVLGLTPDGLDARLAAQEIQDQMELDRITMNGENQKLSKAEINASIEQKEIEHKNRLRQIEIGFYQDKARIYTTAGRGEEAFKASIRSNQIKHGKILGVAMAVQQTDEFKTTRQILNQASAFRSSKSRDMFEIGKSAAIAGAIVNTYMGASKALAEGGPFLGPILAATMVASGFMNVNKIKSQEFKGGQAHGGIDNIPQSMSDKSFLLKGGERVLQPEANKDLTGYLKDKREGGSGNTYNITINASADSDIESIKQAVMDGIREASERGEPIISDKGVIAS